jgi:ComF family protein
MQRQPSTRKRLADKLFPQDCLLCGDPIAELLLCVACRADLPLLAATRCPVCALPTAQGTPCGRCIANLPGFDATLAAMAYAYPLEPLILHYKYGTGIALASLFADAIDGAIPAEGLPDVVTAIPLSRARLVERGFNQALEIAKPLAARRGIPLRADLCVRVRHTGAQADLPYRERRKNVHGAFACIEDLSGMTVAVVDDVMTTGSTLDEFARTLKKWGAARVINWVLARTLPGHR